LPNRDATLLVAAIWIEQANVKMAELNGVETIYFCKQSRSDRAAENVNGCGANSEDRSPAFALAVVAGRRNFLSFATSSPVTFSTMTSAPQQRTSAAG